MPALSRAAAAATLLASASAVPAVPTVTLSNGVKMPHIAAGVWQYNNSEAEASVLAALKAGFRMVDTAYDYHNQEGVGHAVRASGVDRSELFMETKVPGCGMDGTTMRHCYNDTKQILEEDLKLLGMDYLDLVIIHFPPLGSMITRTCRFVCNEVRDQWRALEEFYAAGKAKAIGVSNYCPSCFACLEKDAKVFPMVNQIGYHIGMGPDPWNFRSFADKHNMLLQAYSPLGNTPWKPGANPEILSGNFTSTLAQKHGKSTIQVALKWLVQQGVPVVTKSSNSEHFAQDLDLWSWNLTEREMQQADAFKVFGLPSFACNFAREDGAAVLV